MIIESAFIWGVQYYNKVFVTWKTRGRDDFSYPFPSAWAYPCILQSASPWASMKPSRPTHPIQSPPFLNVHVISYPNTSLSFETYIKWAQISYPILVDKSHLPTQGLTFHSYFLLHFPATAQFSVWYPAHSSWNPWNLDKSIFCMIRRTGSWGTLDGRSSGRPRHDKRTGTFSSTFQPPGRGGALEIELITNVHGSIKSCLHNEKPIQSSKQEGLENFWVGEHIEVLGGWCAHRGGQGSSTPQSPYLTLCIDSIWLFLSCILL